MWEWILENWGVIPAGLIGVSALVEITPIKVNPWSALFGWIGNAMTAGVREDIGALREENQKLDEKIDTVNNKLTNLEMETEREKIEQAKIRLLRFSDEVRRGEQHSLEHWNRHIDDIDKYEAYCESHKEYRNGHAVAAIAISKELYEEHLRKNDFLV